MFGFIKSRYSYLSGHAPIIHRPRYKWWPWFHHDTFLRMNVLLLSSVDDVLFLEALQRERSAPITENRYLRNRNRDIRIYYRLPMSWNFELPREHMCRWKQNVSTIFFTSNPSEMAFRMWQQRTFIIDHVTRETGWRSSFHADSTQDSLATSASMQCPTHMAQCAVGAWLDQWTPLLLCRNVEKNSVFNFASILFQKQ